MGPCACRKAKRGTRNRRQKELALCGSDGNASRIRQGRASCHRWALAHRVPFSWLSFPRSAPAAKRDAPMRNIESTYTDSPNLFFVPLNLTAGWSSAKLRLEISTRAESRVPRRGLLLNPLRVSIFVFSSLQCKRKPQNGVSFPQDIYMWWWPLPKSKELG
jgi:hypothetical protein